LVLNKNPKEGGGGEGTGGKEKRKNGKRLQTSTIGDPLYSLNCKWGKKERKVHGKTVKKEGKEKMEKGRGEEKI